MPRTDAAVSTTRVLERSAVVGVRGTVVFGGIFVSYVVLGSIATAWGGIEPPYPFLSLEGDPVFLIDGTVVGLFIVQGAASLLLYQLRSGFDDDPSSVLLSFVSLGFGGGLLRMTLPKALHVFLRLARYLF